MIPFVAFISLAWGMYRREYVLGRDDTGRYIYYVNGDRYDVKTQRALIRKAFLCYLEDEHDFDSLHRSSDRLSDELLEQHFPNAKEFKDLVLMLPLRFRWQVKRASELKNFYALCFPDKSVNLSFIMQFYSCIFSCPDDTPMADAWKGSESIGCPIFSMAIQEQPCRKWRTWCLLVIGHLLQKNLLQPEFLSDVSMESMSNTEDLLPYFKDVIHPLLQIMSMEHVFLALSLLIE